MEKNNEKSGRYSYEKLSRVIHEKARLSIMTSLLSYKQGISFNDMKELCALSDGNLSRHLTVLEEAKLVNVLKIFEGKRPKTIYTLTKEGEAQFIEYLSELENIVHDVRKAAKTTVRDARRIATSTA